MKIELITTIRELRNKEFMQIYLQLMELTEQYVVTTGDKFLKHSLKRMHKRVERVKQLDVKLNTPSEIVKARNETVQMIKNKIQLIRKLLKALQLTSSEEEREKAEYLYYLLEDLIDWRRMRSIHSTLRVIDEIKDRVGNDETVESALRELSLMERVETLYKLGEEFEQLDIQNKIEDVTAPIIDKRAIREEAVRDLKFLFNSIEVNHSLAEDEVWVEMVEEMGRVAEVIIQLKNEN